MSLRQEQEQQNALERIRRAAAIRQQHYPVGGGDSSDLPARSIRSRFADNNNNNNEGDEGEEEEDEERAIRVQLALVNEQLAINSSKAVQDAVEHGRRAEMERSSLATALREAE